MPMLEGGEAGSGKNTVIIKLEVEREELGKLLRAIFPEGGEGGEETKKPGGGLGGSGIGS